MSVPLRLYTLPEDYDEAPPQEPAVRIRLGDLLPLVALAQRNHYIWLEDFLDDEVMVTNDLYDILQAFRSIRSIA